MTANEDDPRDGDKNLASPKTAESASDWYADVRRDRPDGPILNRSDLVPTPFEADQDTPLRRPLVNHDSPHQTHISDSGGRFWKALGLSDPDWYVDQYVPHIERSLTQLPQEAGTGPLPPEVPWNQMVDYQCRDCKDRCLNHESTQAALNGRCMVCQRLPSTGPR
jgi:hypothetical protein